LSEVLDSAWACETLMRPNFVSDRQKKIATQFCAWIALRDIIALYGCSDRVWSGRLGGHPKFHGPRLVALIIAHRATRASQNEL